MTFVSKKGLILFLAMFSTVLISVIGCGSDKSPTRDNESYSFTLTFGSSSIEIDAGKLTRHTIDGVEGVLLSDLANTFALTEPQNHAYRLIGDDGFYAHIKGNPDNTWEQIQSGYLLLSNMRIFFEPVLGLPGRYNIKNAVEMKILRKIDIITPADSLVQFIVGEMTTTAFEDSLTAVKLTEFITPDITDNLSSYSYELIASDDYTRTIGFDQLREGYYVIEYDRVLYSIADISSELKIKQLNRIAVLIPED